MVLILRKVLILVVLGLAAALVSGVHAQAKVDAITNKVRVPTPELVIRETGEWVRREDRSYPVIGLQYRIVPDASGVTAAWIEVRDGVKLLYRTAVPIREKGWVTWTYEYVSNPERLDLALRAPQVLGHCIDNCAGNTQMIVT